MAIYINPNWAGTESGTKAEPYVSIEAMKIGEAGWSAGETYYIKDGTTQTLTAAQTINAASVTISCYTDAQDDIDPGINSRPKIIAASGATGVQISQASGPGCALRYLDIEAGTTANTRALYIFPPNAADTSVVADATITYCNIHGGDINVRIFASTIEIGYCRIWGAQTDNIFGSGPNDTHIHHNTIWDTGLGAVQADNIQMAANAAGAGDNMIIEYNHVTNLSGIKHNILAPSQTASVNGIVRYNTCIMDCDTGISIKGTDTRCYGNKITTQGTNVRQAMMLITQDKAIRGEVYGNVIEDTSTTITTNGLEALIFTNVDDVEICNNFIRTTCSQANLAGIRMNTALTTGVKACDNVLDGMDLGITQEATEPNTETNNHYYNIGTFNYANEITYTELTTTNATTGDHLVESNYSFPPNSPVIGSGIKWWTGVNREGFNGEPLSDFDTDKGNNQSTYSPFHPKNL